jgi:co-chaperonin GroES (HSP10)
VTRSAWTPAACDTSSGGRACRGTPRVTARSDRILFGKYSGSEIKIDGEEHLIVREEDVLGVVEA